MIVSLKLQGKPVYIIGDSTEAVHRANSAHAEGAQVCIFGFLSQDDRSKTRPGIAVFDRIPTNRELSNVYLVIATDRNRKINEWLHRASQKRKFLLNTLDEKTSCNFFHLATRRLSDNIEIAVSTDGYSPAFASRYVRRIASGFSQQDFAVFEAFVETRKRLKETGLSTFDFDWDFLESSVRTKFESGRNSNFDDVVPLSAANKY